MTSSPSKELRSALLDQLLRILAQTGPTTTPSADALVDRARLLDQLGYETLAAQEFECAVTIDSTNPSVLLEGAQRFGGAFADQLIASPTAPELMRKHSVGYLETTPHLRVLEARLTASVRATIISRAGAEYSLDGANAEDTVVPLGMRKAETGSLIATDHYFLRTKDLRRITITADNVRHAVVVPPLVTTKWTGKNHAFPDANPWIVIPVFDAPAALQRCLASLMPELDAVRGARVLLVDDASRLPETRSILKSAEKRSKVDVLRRTQNGGFTAAVNAGLQAIGAGPVWLLNADTYVPPGTLSRLLKHLEQDQVGTVTPLSNNGGSFSIPVPLTSFEMPKQKDADDLARSAASLHAGIGIDVLTGNGFAMLISEAARAEVGLLSTEYESGYYEEVDFCLRASELGFRHLAALDCFVAHEGAQSYGPEKQRLVQQNQKRLYRRFPFYPEAYGAYQAVAPLAPFAQAIVSRAGWTARRTEDLQVISLSVLNGTRSRLARYEGPDLSDEFLEMFTKVLICPAASLPKGLDPAVTIRFEETGAHFWARRRDGTVIAGLAVEDVSPERIKDFEEAIQDRSLA